MSSKYALAKSNEHFILSEESAMEQVRMLLGYYDIDVTGISPEALTQTERSLDQLRDFIREGRIEVRRDESERVVVAHTLTSGAELIYGELNAQARLAMDKCPGDARYARVYALMGSLCGLGSTAITQFRPRDLAVVDILGPLFMSA